MVGAAIGADGDPGATHLFGLAAAAAARRGGPGCPGSRRSATGAGRGGASAAGADRRRCGSRRGDCRFPRPGKPENRPPAARREPWRLEAERRREPRGHLQQGRPQRDAGAQAPGRARRERPLPMRRGWRADRAGRAGCQRSGRLVCAVRAEAHAEERRVRTGSRFLQFSRMARRTSQTRCCCDSDSPSHIGSRTSRSACAVVTARSPAERPNRIPAGEECSGT